MLTDSSLPGPTQDERNWAMLAHLTALLTVVVGVSTGGMGAVFALLVPLGLYLYFGGRSRYVAFHALQATVFQALGAILYVVLAGVTAAAIASAWVVAGLLSIVLVGLLLMPVALALTLFGAVELLAVPAVWLGYTLLGAYRAYQGEPFEYPWIGALVARTLRPAAVTPAAPAAS